MKAGFNILQQKLDAFIHRYYLNQMIRGLMLIGSVLLGTYLLVATTAFYGDLSSFWRGLLFYAFIALNGSFLWRLVLLPWFRQQGWVKGITHRDAAVMIGAHFPEVRDKLLNTIDLQLISKEESSDLLLASIEQRTYQLQPIPFQGMIDLRKNRKYLRLLMPVLSIFLIMLIAAPGVMRDGGERVIKYQTYFEPIAPFDFVLQNDSLWVEKSADLTLQLKIKGSEIPLAAYIEWADHAYRMEAEQKGSFNYTLKHLQENVRFRFKANKYYSKWFEIKVVPKPVLDNFQVRLTYPRYLDKPEELIDNIGDLLVPEGTQLQWLFEAQSVDELHLQLSNGESLEVTTQRKGHFKSVWKALSPVNYAVILSNALNPKVDSLSYGIQVIPDAYPSINASELADSTARKLRYFNGEIGDDHGFSALHFVYQRYDARGVPQGGEVKEKLNIGKFSRQQFYHYFDFGSLDLRDGAYVNYFFEVADNDGINGPKKARSTAFTFRSLTEKETQQTINSNAGAVEEQLQQAIQEAKEMQRNLDKMRRKLKENKELSWEDKKQLEQLQQQQQQIKEQLEKATEAMKENQELRSEQQKPNELMEKQQKLQEMADRLLNEELKKMMDELQKMMEQQMNKDQMQQKLDQMKLDEKEVEKELDRMLEFFKQMEVEQKTLEIAEELEDLSKKQSQLEKQQNQSSAEDLQQQQEALNKEFKELQQDIKELEQKNEELTDPNDLGDLKEESQEIADKMQDAQSDLQKKQKKEASKKQKEAAAQMKSMAQKMRDKMEQQEMEMLEENIQALRMLLENLIKFSFNQEALMDRLQENSNYSPVYVEIGKDQFKLKEEAKLIEDSLLALSRRVIQLQSTVNREMGLVNDNLNKAVDHLSNRQTPQAKTRQQYAMTSVNNLAVLLSEMLKNMQQEMSQKMQGEQQCQKPGGSGQSKMSKLTQLQKQLNQQMQQMKDGMSGKDGKQKGGKDGKSREMSQGFGEMVAKQEAIRRELQKLSQEMNKDGQGSMGDLDKLAKEMEKTEKELVNKMLTQESMKRQQEIMTRLLEAEKAEREREFDDKRESNTAKEAPRTTPPGFEAYKKQKERSIDLYRTINPELNTFYKKKVDQYFLQLNR
jgi:hypothetical protein